MSIDKVEDQKSGNLYVSGFPKNYTKDDLESIFKPFGRVITAKIIIDLSTGQSKGFGFVRISPYLSAIAAVEGLNDHTIAGNKLTVRISDSEEKFGEESEWIFIRGVKVTEGQRRVRELLSPFGIVEKVKIKNNKKKPRGYLCKFSNKNEAKEALFALNNKTYKGEKYPMYIQFVPNPDEWWTITSSSGSSSSSSSSPSYNASSGNETPSPLSIKKKKRTRNSPNPQNSPASPAFQVASIYPPATPLPMSAFDTPNASQIRDDLHTSQYNSYSSEMGSYYESISASSENDDKKNQEIKNEWSDLLNDDDELLI